MKKIISAAMTAAIACPLATNAQTKLDTTKVQNINEVVVKAVRAPQDITIRSSQHQETRVEAVCYNWQRIAIPFRTHTRRYCMEREWSWYRYDIHAYAWRSWKPYQRYC